MCLDMRRYEKLFHERQKLSKKPSPNNEKISTREPLICKFLEKVVRVQASNCTVEGVLKHVETSEHNGFGNLVLETKHGVVLVRGSAVQSISEVEKRG